MRSSKQHVENPVTGTPVGKSELMKRETYEEEENKNIYKTKEWRTEEISGIWYAPPSTFWRVNVMEPVS